jgi:hypothetical protein
MVTIQSDILLCFLLTILTFGLMAASIIGMHYLTGQNWKLEVSKYWSEKSMAIFMCVVVGLLIELFPRKRMCWTYGYNIVISTEFKSNIN